MGSNTLNKNVHARHLSWFTSRWSAINYHGANSTTHTQTKKRYQIKTTQTHLISSNPRRNLPSIHRNSLRHRILLQLFRINHTKLQFLYSAQPHGGITKVGGHLGEGDGSCFTGCAVFSGCHDDCFVCLFFWCFLLYECNCRMYIFLFVFCVCCFFFQ